MNKLHLVTGYMGEEHIHSADQGSFNAAFFGSGEYVTELGNQFEASIMDNNTVRILDGDALMKGRHLRIEPNTYADVTITTGTAGVNRNDLIVFQYSKDTSTDIESLEIVVIKGTEAEGTATDPAYTDGDILAGATFNQMPMYRVKVEGVVLVAVEPLFTVIPTYKKLAEQYAKQFEEACNTYLGTLNILDTKEEIEANTKENQLAGALALKEVIASISDIVNNLVTTRYAEDTDMWQMKTVSDGVWHDWASGGLNDKPLIPTMTTNTFPYGIASAVKAGSETYRVFDGDTQTYVQSTASGTSPYPYVQYTFDKEVKMCKVELWLGHQTRQDSKFMNILVLIDDVWTNIKSTSIEIPTGNTPTSFIYDFAPQNIKGIRVDLQDTTNSRSLFYGIQVYGKETV